MKEDKLRNVLWKARLRSNTTKNMKWNQEGRVKKSEIKLERRSKNIHGQ